MKTTVAITVALAYLLILSIQPSSSTKLVQPQRSYENSSKFIFSQDSFDSQRFAYAICTANGNINTQQCEVFFQTLKTFNVSRSCNVTLENVVDPVKPRVILLNNDRIILALDTQENDDGVISIIPHFTVIEMDDCNVNQFKRYTGFLVNDYFIQSRSDNTYDVVNMDIQGSFCRWEYNTEKSTIQGPFDCLAKSVSRRNLRGRPINPEQPFKGYIFSHTNDEHWIAIDDLLIRTTFRPPLTGHEIATSTAHNKIGICSSNNTLTTCWQYDRTGELLNAIVLTHGADFGGGIAVYNIKSGGFIIAVGLCEENCTDQYHVPTYYVSKYSASGERIRMTPVRNFQSDTKLYNVALKFYENEEGKICLTMVCFGSITDTNSIWNINLDVIDESLEEIHATFKTYLYFE